jgi:hypothetical protein
MLISPSLLQVGISILPTKHPHSYIIWCYAYKSFPSRYLHASHLHLKASLFNNIWCFPYKSFPSRNLHTTHKTSTFIPTLNSKHAHNLKIWLWETHTLLSSIRKPTTHKLEASTLPPYAVPLYLTPSTLPSRSRAVSSLAPLKSSPSHRQAYPLRAFHNKTKSGPLQLRHFLLTLQQTTHSTTKAYIHSSMKLNNIVSISINPFSNSTVT